MILDRQASLLADDRFHGTGDHAGAMEIGRERHVRTGVNRDEDAAVTAVETP